VRPSFLAALLLLAAAAQAEEPAFEEGDVLGYADVAKLEPFLPPELWGHRELFFYDGMQLEIGPTQRDYSPAAAYVAATKAYAGRAKLGPDGSLEGYVAGQPFPMEKIDCAGDPDAGAKVAWNFDAQWDGAGTDGDFRLAYWDRGVELPLFLEGEMEGVYTAHRVEPAFAATGGVMRPGRRKSAFAIRVTDGSGSERGKALLVVRKLASEGSRDREDVDDVFYYVPLLRRVIVPRDHATVAGTDLLLLEHRGFSGHVPDYTWDCRGERLLLAPMNTKRAGYPYMGSHAFGPTGASYASDRWELRRALELRFVPRGSRDPAGRRDLWVDRETLVPLHGSVYDRGDRLWKILTYDHRWSGDRLPQDAEPWYRGWEGIEEPRDLRVVSEVVANVQTGSVTRVDFWDAHGTFDPKRHHRIDNTIFPKAR
jgi:hypothetical protein